jgi:hypothetical protein
MESLQYSSSLMTSQKGSWQQEHLKDPITHEKIETIKVKYKVLIPDAAGQGEKSLEAPKMLAQQIEADVNKNHCLLEITRHGTGPSTRYTVITA